MDERIKEERIAQARAEIAKRIMRFCRNLHPQDLEKLLDRMALVHFKYDVFPILEQSLPPDRTKGSDPGQSTLS